MVSGCVWVWDCVVVCLGLLQFEQIKNVIFQIQETIPSFRFDSLNLNLSTNHNCERARSHTPRALTRPLNVTHLVEKRIVWTFFMLPVTPPKQPSGTSCKGHSHLLD